jgi:transposase
MLSPFDLDEKKTPVSIPEKTELTNINRISDKYLYTNLTKLSTFRQGDNDLLAALCGNEGCQPAGSKVMMADGVWKNIEEIKLNDTILSPQKDGSYIYANVIKLYKFVAKKTYDIHQLNRQHKKLYSCSYNHEFPINEKQVIKHYSAERFFNGRNNRKDCHDRTSLTAFPIVKFMNRKNCVVEPYTLGVFLGNGCFQSRLSFKKNIRYDQMKRSDRQKIHRFLYRSLEISQNDLEPIEEVMKYYPVTSVQNKKGTTCKAYRFSIFSELAKQLSYLGLEGKHSGSKFIPKEAMTSDLQYRQRLLAGLIDTDGYLSQGLSYSICTKSRIMAGDILDLVYSLGGRGSIHKIKKKIKKIGFEGTYYNVSFYLGDYIKDIPILVERKGRKGTGFTYKSANRTAIKLKENKSKMVYGFTLDSPSHWYVTDNWMITKNTGKSSMALQFALTIDPNFSLENIAFNIEEFLLILQRAKQYDVVIFDEAVMGLYAKDGQRNTTVEIEKMLTTYRWKNLFVILCIPDILMLTPYFRGRRVRAMVRTVLMKNNRTKELDKGFFKFYSQDKIRAIKRDMTTRRTEWPVPNFEGRFHKFDDNDPFWLAYLKLKKSRSSHKKISKKMMKELKKHDQLIANSYSKNDIARMNNVSIHTVNRWLKDYQIWPKRALVSAAFGDTRINAKYYKKGIERLPGIWARVKKQRSCTMKRTQNRLLARKVKKKVYRRLLRERLETEAMAKLSKPASTQTQTSKKLSDFVQDSPGETQPTEQT